VSGWRRLYGRADYAGWKLYLRGTAGQAYVGHSLSNALFWLSVFWLHRLLGRRMKTEGIGDLLEVQLLTPGTRVPR
jgi:hypothetical protein